MRVFYSIFVEDSLRYIIRITHICGERNTFNVILRGKMSGSFRQPFFGTPACQIEMIAFFSQIMCDGVTDSSGRSGHKRIFCCRRECF